MVLTPEEEDQVKNWQQSENEQEPTKNKMTKYKKINKILFPLAGFLVVVLLLIIIGTAIFPQNNAYTPTSNAIITVQPTLTPTNINHANPAIASTPTAHPTAAQSSTATATITATPTTITATPVVTASYNGPYYASKGSTVFHLPGCSYVKKIKQANLITFPTRDAAIAAGYRPCSVCNP